MNDITGKEISIGDNIAVAMRFGNHAGIRTGIVRETLDEDHTIVVEWVHGRNLPSKPGTISGDASRIYIL